MAIISSDSADATKGLRAVLRSHAASLDRMLGKHIVTILTGEVCVSALHLDGNDVERQTVMGTSGLRIDPESHARWATLAASRLERLNQSLCDNLYGLIAGRRKPVVNSGALVRSVL